MICAPERPSRNVLVLTTAVVLLVSGGGALIQAIKIDYDFKHFYRDAVYVWQHQALNPDRHGPDRDTRRQLSFYLPAVPALLAPLGGLPATLAAVVWAALQTGSLVVAILLLRRWADDGPLAAGLILGLPAMYEAARFNQLSLPLLAVLLAAGAALARRRDVRAGVLIGFSAVLKLLPALFGWLLLVHRRWRALAAFVVACVFLTIVPSLVLFGPQRSWAYHRQWWHDNIEGPPAGGMIDPRLREHFIDHRNQSLPAVFSRLLWGRHPYRAAWQPVGLSQVGAARVGRAALGIVALAALAGLAWLGYRRRLPESVALALLAMPLISPLLRSYYLVWAVPALVLLAQAAAGWDPRGRRVGQVGLCVWLLGMLGWIGTLPRSYGIHAWMLIVLGVCVVALGVAGDDERRTTDARAGGPAMRRPGFDPSCSRSPATPRR